MAPPDPESTTNDYSSSLSGVDPHPDSDTTLRSATSCFSGEKSEFEPHDVEAEVVETGSTEVASVTYIQENWTTDQVFNYMRKNEVEFSLFAALPNAAGTVTEASEVNDVIERQRAYARDFDEAARLAFAKKYHENCGILRTIYANFNVTQSGLQMERSIKKLLSPYDRRLLELLQEALPRLNYDEVQQNEVESSLFAALPNATGTEVASVSGEKSESLEVVKTGSTEVASVSGEKSEPVEVGKTGSTEVATVTYILENFTTDEAYDHMQKNEVEFIEALPNAAGTVTEASEVNDANEVNNERQRAYAQNFMGAARLALGDETFAEVWKSLQEIYANHRLNNLEMERSMKELLSPYDPHMYLLKLLQKALPRLNLLPDRSIGENQEYKGVKELPSIPEEE